ncbi:MAG TPA: DsbA family protein [Membranihabitans sp.]|nr:DsbA family protein [Membranihabitans sp.]
MEKKNNPMLCDPETGVCEIPSNVGTGAEKVRLLSVEKPMRVLYFTDPICSSCWGIEPQLRKLKLEYGHALDIEYRMGGLLPDWSYNSGGISGPGDVARHWDEVSQHYDMPIDGDVWLEDPLHSSYPPSIAFKAAQLQDEAKAIDFLREMREMVFLKKMNIARWENIAMAAVRVGLDVVQMKSDFEGQARISFEEDLDLARRWGVRGFPTIFFIDGGGNQEMVYGTKRYPFYEMAILNLNPEIEKRDYSKEWNSLFETYPTLTAREFAELSGNPRVEVEGRLDDLSRKGVLEKLQTRNGSIWERRN